MSDTIYYQTGDIRQEDFVLHLHLLNDSERLRAMRYQHLSDKLRFACTRIALKRLLAQLTKSNAEHIAIQLTPEGQPYCVQEGNRWQISVSHCEQHYLIAATRAELAIGTDLEVCHRHAACHSDMQTSFCHPQEITLLKSLPPSQKNHAAQSIWSVKEALLKARGTGLRSDPCAIRLPVPFPAQYDLKIWGAHFRLTQQTLLHPENPLLLTFCANNPRADWLPVSTPM